MGPMSQDSAIGKSSSCDGGTSRIIVRAVAGDRSAQQEVLARFEPMIRAIVYRHLGPLRVAEDGDDALQMVRLRVLETLSSFRQKNGAALGAWIRQVARNRLLDWEKARRRARRHEPRRVPTGAPEVPGPGQTPSRILMGDEEKHRLKVAMESTPERYRPVLRFLYARDPSRAELAAFLHKDAEAARKFVARALQYLKRALKEAP